MVHFAGDVHELAHGGRGDDRDADTFQIFHNGRGSNLHASWDGGIL